MTTELLPMLKLLKCQMVEITNNGRAMDRNSAEYIAISGLLDVLIADGARPAPSAGAVGTLQLMVDLVNAMSAKMLLQSGEVRAWDNRAMPLLEAFRQAVWAEAMKQADKIGDKIWDTAHSSEYLKGVNAYRSALRTLTPLERKEG